MAPAVQGLSHVTPVVHDLARAGSLPEDALVAEEVYRNEGRARSLMRERFFLPGGVWFAQMQGERDAGRSYEHVALAVGEKDMDAWDKRLREHGVENRPRRPRVAGGAPPSASTTTTTTSSSCTAAACSGGWRVTRRAAR